MEIFSYIIHWIAKNMWSNFFGSLQNLTHIFPQHLQTFSMHFAFYSRSNQNDLRKKALQYGLPVCEAHVCN